MFIHLIIYSTSVAYVTAIIENMTELRQEVCQEAVQQGMMEWLLKRLKVREELFC